MGGTTGEVVPGGSCVAAETDVVGAVSFEMGTLLQDQQARILVWRWQWGEQDIRFGVGMGMEEGEL